MYYFNKIKKYWSLFCLITFITIFIHYIYVFHCQDLIANMYCLHGAMFTVIFMIISRYFLSFLIIDICRLLIGFVIYMTVPKICQSIKQQEFNRVFAYDLNFFFKTQEEKVVENIRSFANNLGDFVPMVVRQLFNPFLDVIICAIFIVFLNHNTGIMVFSWLIWMFIFTYLSVMPQLKFIKERSKIQSSQSKIIIESHKNILISKIYSYEEYDYQQYDLLLEEEARLAKKFLKFSWLQFVGMSLSASTLVCLVVFSIPSVDKLSGIKIVSLTFCLLHAFFRLFANIIPIIQKLGAILGAEENFGKEEKIIKRGNLDLPKNPVIKFENVSKTIDKDTFLKSVNMEIKPNKNVLIEGKSGSGKTTLFLLMLGIIENTQGKITINNIPLLNIKHKEWLNRFSYVPQTAILYDDSIRNNIIRGLDSYDEEDFIKVCQDCLVSDFVSKLENGYDSSVGVSGNNLSGGQRQRVVLARALMRDYNIKNGIKSIKHKRVLCLDEAWASLSREEALKIATNLASDIGNRGFIVIDHTDIWRTVSKGKIDTIYYIENGIVDISK